MTQSARRGEHLLGIAQDGSARELFSASSPQSSGMTSSLSISDFPLASAVARGAAVIETTQETPGTLPSETVQLLRLRLESGMEHLLHAATADQIDSVSAKMLRARVLDVKKALASTAVPGSPSRLLSPRRQRNPELSSTLIDYAVGTGASSAHTLAATGILHMIDPDALPREDDISAANQGMQPYDPEDGRAAEEALYDNTDYSLISAKRARAAAEAECNRAVYERTLRELQLDAAVGSRVQMTQPLESQLMFGREVIEAGYDLNKMRAFMDDPLASYSFGGHGPRLLHSNVCANAPLAIDAYPGAGESPFRLAMRAQAADAVHASDILAFADARIRSLEALKVDMDRASREAAAQMAAAERRRTADDDSADPNETQRLSMLTFSQRVKMRLTEHSNRDKASAAMEDETHLAPSDDSSVADLPTPAEVAAALATSISSPPRTEAFSASADRVASSAVEVASLVTVAGAEPFPPATDARLSRSPPAPSPLSPVNHPSQARMGSTTITASTAAASVTITLPAPSPAAQPSTPPKPRTVDEATNSAPEPPVLVPSGATASASPSQTRSNTGGSSVAGNAGYGFAGTPRSTTGGGVVNRMAQFLKPSSAAPAREKEVEESFTTAVSSPVQMDTRVPSFILGGATSTANSAASAPSAGVRKTLPKWPPQ
jgi:hypothetical protein